MTGHGVGEAVAAEHGRAPLTGPLDSLTIEYSVRSLRGASLASVLLVGLITAYLLLPGTTVDDRRAAWILVGCGAVLTAVTGLAPWRRILARPNGRALAWLWALGGVGLVEIGVYITGGGASELFVMLVAVICFQAGPIYPVAVEILVNVVAVAGYAAVLVAKPNGITAANAGFRLVILAATALGVGLLAAEVTKGLRLQQERRQRVDRRVDLWRKVSDLVYRIDAPDTDAVLAAVVDALSTFDLESADICIVDEESATYRILHSRGLPDEYATGVHPTDTGMVGRVIAAGDTVVEHDYSSLPDAVTALGAEGYRAVAAVPVRANGALVAVLEAGTRRAHTFEPDEIAAFETLAAQAGRAVEHARLLAEERADADQIRKILESSPDAVVVADGSGVVVRVSNRAEELFGCPATELVGRRTGDLMPDRVRREQLSLIDEWLAGMGDDVVGHDREIYVRRSDGREVPVEVTFSVVETGDGTMFVAAIRDVTERREFERRLAHQATHDPLTGLANRDLFVEHLTATLATGGTPAAPVTVCLIDLDHFKYTNDSRGHRAGDLLVESVAQRLRERVPGHMLARIGGDEFGIIAEGLAGQGDAFGFATHVLDVFAEPFLIDNVDTYIAASMGIAFGTGGDAPDDVMRNADAALYRAKRNGRARIEFFDEGLTEEAAHRVAVESALHQALDRDELHLVYQPVVSLLTETVVGMEALVRWNHPDRGPVAPGAFIPIAEDTGLIVPIGRRVLEMALGQLAEWQRRLGGLDDMTMSINVSGRQLEYDRFVAEVAHALDHSSVRPESIVLEITESIFIRDFDATLRRLNALKDLGVRLAIDDFGTGFSSLFSLSHLPVDVVKVDKAFVDGLGSQYDAVVSAVVGVGDAFGLQVVAEGVEQRSQRDRLVELGCRYAQGYYFAKPLSVPDAASLLQLKVAS